MSKDYYEEKIALLEDFQIPITATIEAHLKQCQNEVQMDNYCHSIIVAWLSK